MNRSNLTHYFSKKISAPEAAYALIVFGIALRLLPHAPNITPLGALAIWGGMRLHPKLSFTTLIAILFISDFFIGFHDTMIFVYSALLLAAWIATRVKRVNAVNVALTTISTSVIFFLITNFGVWYVSRFHSVPMYPATFTGLIESYVSGLPFLRASLIGDIGYTVIFFAVELAILTALANKRIVKNVTN